jgi:hypothetical protein
MAAPHAIELAAWFSPEERLLCPACAERAAIAPRGGAVLFCLACGELTPSRTLWRNETAVPTRALAD